MNVLLLPLFLLTDVATPPLREMLEMTRPIVDEASALDKPTEDDLAHRMQLHLTQSGVAVGVLILPSLQQYTLPQVAEAAAGGLKDGFAHEAPWVLVVISTGDRQMNLGVDERLRGMIRDDDVLRLTVAANRAFREDKLQDGVVALVNSIIALTPSAPMRRDEKAMLTVAVAAAVIVVAVAGGVFMRMRRRARSAG